MNKSIEQYRLGFEAWLPTVHECKDAWLLFERVHDNRRYCSMEVEYAWLAYVAAMQQREASTEPSAALVDCIKCEGRGKHAMFDGTTLCDGACAQCGGTGQVRAGALTDDAKDAARYRFIRNADLDAIAAGNWRTGRVLDGAKFDDAIDAAIEAHKTGSGK